MSNISDNSLMDRMILTGFFPLILSCFRSELPEYLDASYTGTSSQTKEREALAPVEKKQGERLCPCSLLPDAPQRASTVCLSQDDSTSSLTSLSSLLTFPPVRDKPPSQRVSCKGFLGRDFPHVLPFSESYSTYKLI